MPRPAVRSQPLEVCLLSLVLTLPLLWIPGFASLYRLPKQAGLAVLAAGVLWAAVAALRRCDTVPQLPALGPVLAYALTTVLSLAVAGNVYEAAVQSAQTLTSLGLFWVVATQLADSAIRRLLGWAAVGGLGVATIGVIQTWGLEIPTLIRTGYWGSTFGNVNGAARYIVLVLPLSTALFVLATRRRAVWGWAFVTAMIASYLSYTGTRSAFVGIALAAVIVAAILVRRRLFGRLVDRLRDRAWALAAIVVFVAAMNLGPRIWLTDWGGSRASVSARLATVVDEGEGRSTIRLRIAIWRNTWPMVLDHPAVGVGKANFQFVYPRYATSVVKDVAMGSQNERVRDAHNDYLQLLAETGVLGVLAFAWVLVTLGHRFIAGLAGPPASDWTVIALASAFGVLSMLGVAMFDFPFQRAVPEALFWILAGVLWRASARQGDPLDRGVAPRRVTVGLLVIVACLVTASAAWGLQAVRAEYHFSRGGYAYGDGDFDEARREFTTAVRQNPFDHRYWFMLGLCELVTRRYEDATRDILKNLALNPLNIRSLDNLAVALAAQGRVPDAIGTLEHSLRIWPDQPGARNNLGALYVNVGRREEAIAQFREVLRLRPDHEEARRRLDILLGRDHR